MAKELVAEIINKRGLHARAAAKFVKIVTAHAAQVQVVKLGEENSPPVGGSSILGLMMLGADPGSKLYISAMDDGAEEVIAALKQLIENRFGEDE